MELLAQKPLLAVVKVEHLSLFFILPADFGLAQCKPTDSSLMSTAVGTLMYQRLVASTLLLETFIPSGESHVLYLDSEQFLDEQ